MDSSEEGKAKEKENPAQSENPLGREQRILEIGRHFIESFKFLVDAFSGWIFLDFGDWLVVRDIKSDGNPLTDIIQMIKVDAFP